MEAPDVKGVVHERPRAAIHGTRWAPSEWSPQDGVAMVPTGPGRHGPERTGPPWSLEDRAAVVSRFWWIKGLCKGVYDATVTVSEGLREAAPSAGRMFLCTPAFLLLL